MNTQKKVLATTVFVGLAVVFTVLAFAARAAAEPFAQTLMISLGSAIFGAGLLFFLVRFTDREG